MVGAPAEAADLVEAHAAHQLLHGQDFCAESYARAERQALAATADPLGAAAWDLVAQAVEAMAGSWIDGETGEPIRDAAAIAAVDDATAAVYRAANLAPPAPPVGSILPSLILAPANAATAGLMTRTTTTVDHVVDGWMFDGSEGRGPLRASGPDDVAYALYDGAPVATAGVSFTPLP